MIEGRNLSVTYQGAVRYLIGPRRKVPVIHDVTIDVRPGEMLGVVGESGSGKSTLGRALFRFKNVAGGSIIFEGKDITTAQGRELRSLRSRMQIVFQDPYSSLNPRNRISRIVKEPLRLSHPGESDKAHADRVSRMLDLVGLNDRFADRFPHELSGGQRQRVAIARALISEPDLVIADEPVSALDVTVQAQILELFADLQERFDFACLFISHDLSVVESLCDRIMVLYRGRTMEQADTKTLFRNPCHPYTRRLLAASQRLEKQASGGYKLRLPGQDAPAEEHSGYFWPTEGADADRYDLREVEAGHYIAFDRTA